MQYTSPFLMHDIYYNDYTNAFETEFGILKYDISSIMPFDEVMKYKEKGGTYYARGGEYEIEFPIRDINRSLFYDLYENTMTDEDGDIVFNLFSIIKPSDLYLFKLGRKSMTVTGKTGGIIKMIYPE